MVNNIILTSTNHGPCQLGHIGTVVDVIAGRLPTELAQRKFKANDYAYGFELATPQDAASLGEAIMVNGMCYSTSTDKDSNTYAKLLTGPEFITSGMFLIPHTAKPSHHAKFIATAGSLNLLDFYSYIYQKIQRPLVFVAVIQFSNLHATAIGKAPIHGVNIFDNSKEYYCNPEINQTQVNAFVMGAMTDYKTKQYAEVNKALEAVLYRNPFDENTGLTHHAHILTLKQPVDDIAAITPALADRALHLFVEGSTVQTLSAAIYTVNSLKNYA